MTISLNFKTSRRKEKKILNIIMIIKKVGDSIRVKEVNWMPTWNSNPQTWDVIVTRGTLFLCKVSSC